MPHRTRWRSGWGCGWCNDTLAENYIRPDEATKAQSLVKEKGRHTLIDKIKVRITRFTLLG